jgi:outer membrane protein OmpA-like peptidoglycan-associated protein
MAGSVATPGELGCGSGATGIAMVGTAAQAAARPSVSFRTCRRAIVSTAASFGGHTASQRAPRRTVPSGLSGLPSPPLRHRRRGHGGLVLLGLAMPMITIPRDRYIVDVDSAPPTLLYQTLAAPPLVPLERAYSLDEIRDNVELRARVRSVDINTINFATGSWEVSPDQIPQLQALAEAMMRVITENPSTVFMITGHTDARRNRRTSRSRPAKGDQPNSQRHAGLQAGMIFLALNSTAACSRWRRPR